MTAFLCMVIEDERAETARAEDDDPDEFDVPELDNLFNITYSGKR
jgi:hypothetical protein